MSELSTLGSCVGVGLSALVGGCGPSAPTIPLMCPPLECNRVTGGVAGQSLVLADTCVLVGAFFQTVLVAEQPFSPSGCDPEDPQAPGVGLEVRFGLPVAGAAEFSFARWWSRGLGVTEPVEATDGNVDVELFDINEGVHVGFELDFDGEQVCGCVDTRQ